MSRTLVEGFLAKAELAEKQGNTKEAQKWLALAEKADRAYEKLEMSVLELQKKT